MLFGSNGSNGQQIAKEIKYPRLAALEAIKQPESIGVQDYRVTLSWGFGSTGFEGNAIANVETYDGLRFAIPLRVPTTGNSMQALEAINSDIVTFLQRLDLWRSAQSLEERHWHDLEKWIETVQQAGGN